MSPYTETAQAFPLDFDGCPPPVVGPMTGRVSPYQWRGIMVDSARTCFPPRVIIAMLQIAARYGFTTFHWHLTDDAGWRFAVPGYPRLETVAATLPRSDFEFYNNLKEGTRESTAADTDTCWTNGFYSDADIASIVAAAQALGIEIVPEVDLPGHMEAAIIAYPELGRPEGSPLPEGSMRPTMFWPARNDLLWPTEKSLAFIDAALTRICELIPGTRIHIGGDECVYAQWESDATARAFMAEHGMDDPRDIHRWFMEHATRTIATLNRKVMGWDEVCEITNDPDIDVIAWDEKAGLERIKKTTNNVILADARTFYLNRVDPESPQRHGGMVSGISVSDILTADLPVTREERCIGLQTCLWSEFILDGTDLFGMALPRALAVAERMWTTSPAAREAEERVRSEYRTIVPVLKKAGFAIDA